MNTNAIMAEARKNYFASTLIDALDTRITRFHLALSQGEMVVKNHRHIFNICAEVLEAVEAVNKMDTKIPNIDVNGIRADWWELVNKQLAERFTQFAFVLLSFNNDSAPAMVAFEIAHFEPADGWDIGHSDLFDEQFANYLGNSIKNRPLDGRIVSEFVPENPIATKTAIDNVTKLLQMVCHIEKCAFSVVFENLGRAYDFDYKTCEKLDTVQYYNGKNSAHNLKNGLVWSNVCKGENKSPVFRLQTQTAYGSMGVENEPLNMLVVPTSDDCEKVFDKWCRVASDLKIARPTAPMNTVGDKLDRDAKEIAKLREELTRVTEQRHCANKSCDTYRTQLVADQQKLVEAGRELEKVRADCRAKAGKISFLVDENTEVAKALDKTNVLVSNLEDNLGSANARIEELEGENFKANNDIEHLTQVNERLIDQLENANCRVSQLEGENTEISALAETTERTAEKLSQQLTEAQTVISDCSKMILMVYPDETFAAVPLAGMVHQLVNHSGQQVERADQLGAEIRSERNKIREFLNNDPDADGEGILPLSPMVNRLIDCCNTHMERADNAIQLLADRDNTIVKLQASYARVNDHLHTMTNLNDSNRNKFKKAKRKAKRAKKSLMEVSATGNRLKTQCERAEALCEKAFAYLNGDETTEPHMHEANLIQRAYAAHQAMVEVEQLRATGAENVELEVLRCENKDLKLLVDELRDTNMQSISANDALRNKIALLQTQISQNSQ